MTSALRPPYAEGDRNAITPDLQARLEQLASATGRPQGEFVLDAMTGCFNELEQVRGTLGSRYDEIKSRKVQLIDGEEFFETLRRPEDELLAKRSPATTI